MIELHLLSSSSSHTGVCSFSSFPPLSLPSPSSPFVSLLLQHQDGVSWLAQEVIKTSLCIQSEKWVWNTNVALGFAPITAQLPLPPIIGLI
jgi:hypothetical protein